MNIWQQAAKGLPAETEHRLTDRVTNFDVANEALIIDRVKAAISTGKATETDAARIFDLGSVKEKLEATEIWKDLVIK